jgi:hypothetical protein
MNLHTVKAELDQEELVKEELRASMMACSKTMEAELPSLGVLGAAVAFLILVDLARLLWMRHYGTAGPLFPWDM